MHRSLFAVAALMFLACGSNDHPDDVPADPHGSEGATPIAQPTFSAPSAGTPAADAGASCNNSLDLEGCTCSPGSPPRQCYAGPAEQAGVGSCTWGKQECGARSELGSTWGACTGSGLDCPKEPSPSPAQCVPKTCAELGAECGLLADGCGGTLDCGSSCPGRQTCGGTGQRNKCGCNISGVPLPAVTGACPAGYEAYTNGIYSGCAPEGHTACHGTDAQPMYYCPNQAECRFNQYMECC